MSKPFYLLLSLILRQQLTSFYGISKILDFIGLHAIVLWTKGRTVTLQRMGR